MDSSKIFSPAFRRYLYSVVGALFLVLGVKGVLEADVIAALNILASAVLGVATANVPSLPAPGAPASLVEEGDGEGPFA